jgi:xanthine dehydrogenase accessory factor
MSVLTRLDNLRTGRTPCVLATVVRAERPTSAKPGDRALVLPDGTMEGFVGGECAESTVRSHGLRLLASGESTLLRITPTESAETVTEGLVTVGNPCLSGGTLEIFLEAVVPPKLVHVHGDGPVAHALVAVGRACGHDVELAGDELPSDLAALVVA